MLNRRKFLQTTSSAALTAGGLAGLESHGTEPAPQAAKSPVVDTHMHVWIDDPVRFPFAHPYQADYRPPDTLGTLEVLLADMDQNGVTHAILVQTVCHGWDNRYTAHCVRACPTRLRGHGLIDPLDPNVADKLSYWVREQGLSGMRFSPIYYKGKDDWLTAEPAERMWTKAGELGAVLNFFIATEQLPKLETMVRRHPEVPTIIDHLSQIDLSVADPLPEMKKLLALARYPNVRVKVSELTSVSKSHEYPFGDALPWVKMVYEVFGPTRLLWGTGYPGVAREFYKRPTLAEELTLVREKIPFFTADDRQKILGENAAAIWKLQA
ncbi:MAG TPA: amidohydrolase family protein [Pirellulales bacterium]|jgi:2-pyrone-4,6-dicarboxylate lactonase